MFRRVASFSLAILTAILFVLLLVVLYAQQFPSASNPVKETWDTPVVGHHIVTN